MLQSQTVQRAGGLAGAAAETKTPDITDGIYEYDKISAHLGFKCNHSQGVLSLYLDIHKAAVSNFYCKDREEKGQDDHV